ncbi:MAG TPA: deoxyribonuclease IV [Candidatus Aquicultor sp.]|jgi:deoxyribonuclease-4
MLGATVPTIGGLHNAFKYAADWGCECLQIYLTMSRRWDTPRLSEEARLAFLQAWRTSNVKQVISHVPFLVNVASPEPAMWQKSVNRLHAEIQTAVELEVPLLILHPGSARGTSRADGVQRVIEALNTVLADAGTHSPIILIETMAGQGSVLGSTFDELAEILQGIESRSHVGVCFDVAHVFAAGYDISGTGGYEQVTRRFDESVGLDAIGVVHINDSKTKLGSHHDRHAYVGEGEIGLDMFRALLTDRHFVNVPKVLELPGREDGAIKANLAFVRGLAP